MKDVAQGRLIVRSVEASHLLRARHLIRYAGVLKRRRMGSADAVIAACCLDLALELKQEIIFYIHDKTLYTILQDINAFTSALNLRYIDRI